MTENVKYHLPIYKFDTLEELERFKSDLADILSFDGSYDEILSFNDMHADCDEIFFEENTLLLVYVSATSGSYRFGISSIERSDNSLLINVEQINFPEDVTDDMMGWFITVPLSDSSLNECHEFDAVLID